MHLINASSAVSLYGVAACRQIEHLVMRPLPARTLMQRAGLAVARLALALAPHARVVWVACGPGNNGGDGFEAALHLLRMGKQPVVTWLGSLSAAPADAAAAFERATSAGVPFADHPPAQFDLAIDAMLGIGAKPVQSDSRMADWIACINASAVPVLAVDVPTGLNADTGAASPVCITATHTLCLLTPKPGLFTAQGRDAAGTVWLDMLGTARTLANAPDRPAPDARLPGLPPGDTPRHDCHKGSLGDVAVVGGASGMTGAALLAARAALSGGAGRVYVCLQSPNAMTVDEQHPELMFRSLETLATDTMTVVCGCGGGAAIAHCLPTLLASPSPLVLDADALNAIAADPALQRLACNRTAATVMTPHPLEAARLLACHTAQVQADRLASAAQIAQRYGCTVVLKGSGSIIAQTGQTPVICPTGCARLATAGTGDVLAGMIGCRLAGGQSALDAACWAVYQHGHLADHWPAHTPLTASALARAVTSQYNNNNKLNTP